MSQSNLSSSSLSSINSSATQETQLNYVSRLNRQIQLPKPSSQQSLPVTTSALLPPRPIRAKRRRRALPRFNRETKHIPRLSRSVAASNSNTLPYLKNQSSLKNFNGNSLLWVRLSSVVRYQESDKRLFKLPAIQKRASGKMLRDAILASRARTAMVNTC